MESFLKSLKCKSATPDAGTWNDSIYSWNKCVPDLVGTPSCVVFPETEDDISAIVKYGAANKLRVTARSGGHGMYTFFKDCILIDMQEFKEVKTIGEYEDHHVVRVGMGNTLAEVDEKTHPFHVPVGVVSHTGCGLLFSNGVGWQSKRHGTSPHNIVGARVCLASGEFVTVSEKEHPDIFWALRGCAYNLGIVTWIDIKAFKYETALTGMLGFPLSEENLKKLLDWSDQDEVLNNLDLTPYVGLLPNPEQKIYMAALIFVYLGSDDDGVKKLLNQLEGAIPMLPPSRMPFSDCQKILDKAQSSAYYHGKVYLLPGQKTPSKLSGIVDAINKFPNTADKNIALVFEQRGGETSEFQKPSSDSIPHPWRGSRWEAYPFTRWTNKEDSDTMLKEARFIGTVLQESGFVNNGRGMKLNNEQIPVENYYGDNSTRLREIFRKLDPEGIFNGNNGMKW